MTGQAPRYQRAPGPLPPELETAACIIADRLGIELGPARDLASRLASPAWAARRLSVEELTRLRQEDDR